jgi:dTDP-4-amino-4,6-dideoxygalactose transaminase
VRELPPTAGLPLRLCDLLTVRANTGTPLGQVLALPAPILTSSGSAALWIVLEALKQRHPDRGTVIVPAFTCPRVALAVHQAGLALRLCDTRREHFDLDPEALRALVHSDTLAVITTHLGGRVADVAGVGATVHAAGACLIEDAAQALGARTATQSVGLSGDVGFFSLGAGKGLSIFEGGLIVARDAELRQAIERMHTERVRRQPLTELWRCAQLVGLCLLYRPWGLVLAYGWPLRRALARGDVVGALAERFEPLIALRAVSRWRQAVALRAGRRLAAFLAAGSERAHIRRQRLEQIPGITVLQDAPGVQGTWPYFIVLLPDSVCRDRALARLWTAGLGVSRAFALALPDYAELARIVPAAAVPNARDFAARTLTVSNTHWMTEREFETVCSAIAAACGERVP